MPPYFSINSYKLNGVTLTENEGLVVKKINYK